MEEHAKLIYIENDHKITPKTDGQFLFAYQQSILLALKDNGVLTEVQYRYAEEKLKDQHRTFVKPDTACESKRKPHS